MVAFPVTLNISRFQRQTVAWPICDSWASCTACATAILSVKLSHLCIVSTRLNIHCCGLIVSLFIERQHTDARCGIAILSVRLSVGSPSVRHVWVLYRNGLTYRHDFFTTIILVLWVSIIFSKFRRSHPCGGAKYRSQVAYKNFAIFDQ